MFNRGRGYSKVTRIEAIIQFVWLHFMLSMSTSWLEVKCLWIYAGDWTVTLLVSLL